MACPCSTNKENACHHINGITKWGGGTSPTLPHWEIAPILKRSINHGIRNKLSKQFTRRCLRKKSDEMVTPNQVFSPILTFKRLKEISHVNTVLDPQQNLGRKIKRGNFGDLLPGWKMICRLPATKESGSLNRHILLSKSSQESMETSARTWPFITSTNLDAICMLPSAIPWATLRGEPSKPTQRT